MTDPTYTRDTTVQEPPIRKSDPIPVFCIRYQIDGMERTKPLRVTHIQDPVICTGRPFTLEPQQACRVLLFCKDSEVNYWADGVVTDPPSPFENHATLRGVRLCGHGKFHMHDYLQAVARSLLKFFQGFEQYQPFTLADCLILAQLAGTRELVNGEVLYEAGRHSPDENDLYLVTAGSLKAYTRDPADPRDNIAAIVLGQLLGEMSLVIDQPHSASIAALAHAWLIQFSRSGIRQLEYSHPQLFIKLYKLVAKTLVRRLARTTARWKKD